MVEVQKHGFIFETWIKKILGVKRLAEYYTQKWDIPGEMPVSVKCMGLKNALELGSTVRFWEINKPFTLVIGRWKQVGVRKKIVSIDEIDITPEILKKLRGRVSLKEIRIFDKKIKTFPPGKAGQKKGIKFAREWKNKNKNRFGLLTITHKIDSKEQRRIQCNLNLKNYVEIFGKISMKAKFRGVDFKQKINHASRKFNEK